MIWYFLFACNPGFMAAALIGLLGDEAKVAAEECAPVMGVALLLALLVVVLVVML